MNAGLIIMLHISRLQVLPTKIPPTRKFQTEKSGNITAQIK